MIVVRIFGRDGRTEDLKFDNKEMMSTYIKNELFNIREFKVLNDGRMMIEFRTIDKKTIIRPTECEDLLEGILDAMEQTGLESERVKNIHIIRPKKEEKNEDAM